jgi:gas vesicle protein
MKPLPFIAGFLLTVYSGTVFAAPGNALSLDAVVTVLGGIVITAFWLWVASVSSKQKDTDKKVDETQEMVIELQTALLSKYHPKEDVREMMREVLDALKELRNEFRDNQREWKEKFTHFENLYGR